MQILDEDLREPQLPGGTCNVASPDASHDGVVRNPLEIQIQNGRVYYPDQDVHWP